MQRMNVAVLGHFSGTNQTSCYTKGLGWCVTRKPAVFVWECAWLDGIVCCARFWCGKCGRTCPALFGNLTLFLPVVADSAIYFVNGFFFFFLSTLFVRLKRCLEYWLPARSISLTTFCTKLEQIFTISSVTSLYVINRHLLLYSSCSKPGSEDSGSHSLAFIIGMFYINRTWF